MKIYDDTQHHQGIDLEGNDINKAKFPRIERDGLFIDEVRSNPTTGLLEIWDGTQWLGYIENPQPQGESVNIETLTADKTLTASDATVQIYTSTANRVINLPTTGLTIGQKFEIWNDNAYDSSFYLTIKQGATELYRVTSQTKIELRWDGTNWITEWRYNISIGDTTYNNHNHGIGIGRNANGNSSYGIGIGRNAYSNSTSGVGIGNSAYGNSSYGVGIGNGAMSNSTSGVGIGNYAYSNNTYGIGIGNNARSNSNRGIGIGDNASGNKNYSIGLGAFAGNGQSRANTLYIHSSTETVGANALIYGEFDNRIVRINNTLYVNDLVGTGDRPVLADPTGKLKVGTTTTPSSQVQSDWNQTDNTQVDYIKNKPTIPNPSEPISFDKLITTPSTMVEITAAELGLDGQRLTTIIRSFDPYFYNQNNDTMSTVDIQDKIITPATVAIGFAQQYPAGTRVRVLLTLR